MKTSTVAERFSLFWGRSKLLKQFVFGYPDAASALLASDPDQYALTLLEDGTPLLQTYWEMDGMPWVSYGRLERTN